MKLYRELNPKIRYALWAAVAVGVVNVANAILNVYPNEAWTPIVSALIPVVVGWFPASTPKETP